MIDNNNIEELIKQKLNNFESEVSANVWDKIDSQLDQLQPANNPGAGSDAIVQTAGTNVTAWVAGIGAAVIGVATIGVLFFGDTEKSSDVIAEKTEVVSLQPVVTNDISSSDSELINSNADDKVISIPTEKELFVAPIIEKTENSIYDIPAVENESSTVEKLAKNKNLNSANDFESEVSEGINELNSNSSENKMNEADAAGVRAIDNSVEEKTQNVFEEAPGITDELIGQKIEEQEAINIQSSSIGQIPNVFTPNGDGINDHFIFATENIAELRVNIYSARGELVFVISGNDKWNWDGDLRTGQSAVEGNYYYAVYATGFDGKKHQKKGTLYLNR